MNDGRSEWPPLCQTVHASRTDVLIARRQWESRDALMVSGFDLIGHNRTFQIHWIKRVLAYVIDLAATLAELSGDRDPRQRWPDNVLGPTVPQSHLIHVREHSFDSQTPSGR